jgi:AcrR family transcriptional regulator
MQKNMRLIQNCLQILLTYGIRVSMDDIAKELGMSKRTLYEIFENKNELIYKCISLFIKEEKERMDNYLSKYSSNIIEELFPFYNIEIYNIMKENCCFFSDIKRYYPEIFDKMLSNHWESYLSHIGEIVNKGVKQGDFRKDINVELVTAFLFDLMTTPKQDKELFKKYSNRKYSMANIFENTVLCYIRGISTEKGQQLIDNIIKRDYSHFENEIMSETV